MAGAVVFARARLADLELAERAMAVAVMATAGIVAVHLMPGALGILSRGTALAGGLAVLGAALLAARRAPAQAPAAPRRAEPDPSSRLSWAIALTAAGVLALWLVATAWNRTVLPPEDVDTLSFHLPDVGKWIQSGTFWRVDQFVALIAHGNYPQNGDVVFLSVVLPWHNDAFVGLVNPVYAVLCGVAAYALARALGAPRATSVIAGSLLVAVPDIALGTNSSAMTDLIMVAMLGGGALFLLRHWRSRRTADLVLAGLGLGLAFGTKWYATWAAAIVALVWLGAHVRRRRLAPRQVGLLAGLMALSGGFWLVRNWVESRDPVFPARVRLLGTTIFHAPPDVIRECASFSVAHYLFDGNAWRHYLWPAYGDTYAWPGAVIAAGALVAVVVWLIGRRRGHGGGAVPAVLACALLLAVGYALTPDSAFGPEGRPVLAGANARYLLPAMLAWAPLAAWAGGRTRGWRPLAEALGLAAVISAIGGDFTVRAHVVLGVLGGLVALAAVVLALRRVGGRRLRVAAAVLAAAVLVAVGHARQRDYNEHRYASGEPVTAWIAAHADSGHRIGLAGAWTPGERAPVWPAFGRRLGNQVAYAGPTVEHLLREHASRRAWLADVRRNRFDLLVVGRGGYSKACPVPGLHSDDDAWARAAGFQQVVRTPRLTLYRVPRT